MWILWSGTETSGLILPQRPVHIKPGRNLSNNITTPRCNPSAFTRASDLHNLPRADRGCFNCRAATVAALIFISLSGSFALLLYTLPFRRGLLPRLCFYNALSINSAAALIVLKVWNSLNPIWSSSLTFTWYAPCVPFILVILYPLTTFTVSYIFVTAFLSVCLFFISFRWYYISIRLY